MLICTKIKENTPNEISGLKQEDTVQNNAQYLIIANGLVYR